MADAGMLGRCLSHYRILELLGSGGMGDVYRARDENLNRDVALKVIPSGLRGVDAGRRRRRFKKECLALCRVAHPHVATLFDFGTADGLDFLVMELVPGPNLEMMLRGRRLREEQAVKLGSQLARGLQAAHGLGVVHRDIKPSNIGFTADGLLKILDFGVARLPPHLSAGEETETMTEVGAAPGSLPYMPPEQLLGGVVDGRSDLYAVGAVIYEMVTGCRVFGPRRGPELTDAILHTAPLPPRETGTPVSPGLEAVILKLLDKDPQLRYQSARELLVDLQRLERAQTVTTSETAPLRQKVLALRRSSLTAAAFGALAAIVAVGSTLTVAWRPPGDDTRAAGITTQRRSLVPLTSSPGSERHPALSPSGRRLAFVGDGGDPSKTEVYVQDVGSHQAVAITGSRLPECCVAWAPDERTLVFVRTTDAQGSIMTISAGGGVERRLAGLTPWFGTALSVSADGRALAYPDRRTPRGPFSIHLLPLETLESRPITEPPAEAMGDAFPAFSPDGEWLAFARIKTRLALADVYVVPAEGGEARRLTTDLFVGDLGWAPGGRSLLVQAEWCNVARMWQVGLDGGKPLPYWREGDPLPPRRFSEAEGPARVSSAFRFSVAPGGGQMAFTQSTYDTDIWQLEIGDHPHTDGFSPPLIASTRTDESPQFSPDGSRIAFSSLRSGLPQIWICDRTGSDCAPLLAASQHDGTPRWSPDGRRIAFDARPEGLSHIHVVDVESRLVRALTDEAANDVVPCWSRDGQWIYFASDRTGSWQVFKVPAAGGVARQITVKGGFAAFESPTSPGRLLYTRFDAPGLWSVSVSGGDETLLLGQPQCWGHWAIASDGVYVVASLPGQLPRLLFLDPETAQTRQVATLPRPLPCGESALAVSPDGRDVLYSGVRESSDLVLFRP